MLFTPRPGSDSDYGLSFIPLKFPPIAQNLYTEPVNSNHHCSISGEALAEPESGQGVNSNESLTFREERMSKTIE
jgi:hypothetical protein